MEADGFGGLDLKQFFGFFWISSHAGLAFNGLKGAKPYELNFSMMHSYCQSLEHGFDGIGSGTFGGLFTKNFLNGFNELRFVHQVNNRLVWVYKVQVKKFNTLRVASFTTA